MALTRPPRSRRRSATCRPAPRAWALTCRSAATRDQPPSTMAGMPDDPTPPPAPQPGSPHPVSDHRVLVLAGAGVDTIVRVEQLELPLTDGIGVPPILDYVAHTGNG